MNRFTIETDLDLIRAKQLLEGHKEQLRGLKPELKKVVDYTTGCIHELQAEIDKFENPTYFKTRVKYNAMFQCAIGALANGHLPSGYLNLVFVEQYDDENGVTMLKFLNEQESIEFDAAFVNNGRHWDNSAIIVESKIVPVS